MSMSKYFQQQLKHTQQHLDKCHQEFCVRLPRNMNFVFDSHSDKRNDFPELKTTVQRSSEIQQELLRETECTKLEIRDIVGRLAMDEADYEKEKAETDTSMRETEDGVAQIHDRLSFTIKQVSNNGTLEVHFSNINFSKPDKTYKLKLSLDKDTQRYIVEDLEGADGEFESLVNELNDSNDLRTFLVKARQRYVNHALIDKKLCRDTNTTQAIDVLVID